jgi:hypothetical protein
VDEDATVEPDSLLDPEDAGALEPEPGMGITGITSRILQLPLGRRGLPLPPRYACPNGDGYEYWRFDVAKPVPPCPNDGAALVLDDDDDGVV